MADVALPARARVVVIGGGVIGCSVAYHLAHLGLHDVVLLEQHRLTAGTTWHSAGLIVTFGSTSETSTQMRRYTRDLYARLEAETGLSTGFRPVGFIELATDRDRLQEYRRVAAFNRYCGVDVHEIGPRQVRDLFPLARTDDVLAGFYVKEDGRANPVDVAMSLAKGARMRGATIVEGTRVEGFLQRGGAVAGVRTSRGDIEAEYVVNCAGIWARQLGAKAGVCIPLQAAEHYYLITDKIADVSPSLPVLEDPASYGYIREEVGALMVGLFEPVCAPWNVAGIPESFHFGEIPPDWERMAPYIEKALGRLTVSPDIGIRKLFCGPESFTPDLQPIVGEAPELKNYFVAAGLNSIGVLTGGGIGRLLAHWIVDGRPDVDVTGFNIDRLQAYQCSPAYLATRTVEALGMVYQCHYPYRTWSTARGAKQSALNDRLAARGAYFRDVSGWEAADWYATPGLSAGISSPSWDRPPWFSCWEAEHRAARQNVVLMDMSFMTKFAVQGRDAGRLLNFLSVNDVDRESGTVTYTPWLNEAGKLEADLTVTKLDPEHYWVIASDTAHRHVESWMRRHCGDSHVWITDVTSAYAQLNLHGPKSRDLLQSITTVDLSNATFPFRTAREIDIGFARVLCLRITYVGELGYELYVPVEQATAVYDRVVEAGGAMGLQHAGLKALSSLRMEKGYRDYGHDIDNTDSIFEAGLDFAMKVGKPEGFVGRGAVVKEMAHGPAERRLLQFLLRDPQPLLFHAEVVLRDGKPAGYVRSASYGFTLGGAVGLAMIEAGEPVDQAYVDRGHWEIDVGGSRFPAVASIRPLYDPQSKRVKG